MSDSKELTVIKPEAFPALIEGSETAKAMIANTAGVGFTESDLIRVPTPSGGACQWVVPEITGDKTYDALTGLMVYYAPRGTLWPTEEPAGEGVMPLLVTTDLVKAVKVGDDYGDIDPAELERYLLPDGSGYDWQALPWNKWGSGKNGIGKRCKESRLLMLLREGEAFPLVIRAQPGSLKTVRPFVTRLPVPFYRAVVELSLRVAQSKGGLKYSQIVPRMFTAFVPTLGAPLKEFYTDNLGQLASRVMESDRMDVEEEAIA